MQDLTPGPLTERTFAAGTLLIAPPDVGARAGDVLCVFDSDPDEPGAAFALVLNRPTDRPAQPLAFGIFDCGDDVLWWGGPTAEAFAIVLHQAQSRIDRRLPDGTPRVFLTAQTALYLPGSDHPPDAPPQSVRVFTGSIWLSPDQTQLYRTQGTVLSATDDVLFDPDPGTLADRLRVRR
jgi:hypothetical protein